MSLNGHDLVWADEAEVVFLVIYISEILLRCIAEKWGCLFDWWFLFDFTLVLSACVEQVAYIFTGSSADQIMILRLLRLIRLVRSFRMIKQIKSIWRLVYGLLTCGQTMFSTFALLSLVIYVFGVLGTEGMKMLNQWLFCVRVFRWILFWFPTKQACQDKKRKRPKVQSPEVWEVNPARSPSHPARC